MINLLTSLSKRIIGRLAKMKMIRELLLVIFAMLFAFSLQVFSDSLKLIAVENKPLNLAVILILLIPLAYLALLAYGIHYIDKSEDTKEDRRHKELLDAIKLNKQFYRRASHGKRKSPL